VDKAALDAQVAAKREAIEQEKARQLALDRQILAADQQLMMLENQVKQERIAMARELETFRAEHQKFTQRRGL